jgi:hypothetical protein
MPLLSDIRARTSAIDLALLLAVFAALYSSATRAKGSLANDVALAGVHWMVVLLLGTAKLKPSYVRPCDVEVTWLLYGVLFGEMELDAVPAFVAMLMSAYAFKLHKRQQRITQESIASAAPDGDISGSL